MFDDFGEREHVFYLLEEWATSQNSVCLEGFVSGRDTEFRRRVKEISMKLAELEGKNTRPPLKLIHSHQSDLLGELDWLLSDSDRPLRLRKCLDRLKLLIMDAWVISLELKAGILNLNAKKGEAFTRSSARGLSPLYSIVLGVLNKHGKKMPAKDVWERLKDHEGGDVIDEISGDPPDGEIFLTGKEKPTTFKAFQTQLSEVRKKVTE